MTKTNVAKFVAWIANLDRFDEDCIYNENGRPNEIVYDDGTLHVTVDGVRYCLDVGQYGAEVARANALAKKVVARGDELGISFSSVRIA